MPVLAYPTVKAFIFVVTTYYVRVSDAAVVSVFISAETETSSNCRRCLVMDVRVDSNNQPLTGTPQYVELAGHSVDFTD
jgi:hypothetical protein